MTSHPLAFVTELLHILFWYRIIIVAIVQPGKETGIKDVIVIDITGTFLFMLKFMPSCKAVVIRMLLPPLTGLHLLSCKLSCFCLCRI